MKNIYLVGMMGCGKSTVGRILAEQIGARMVDTDFVIESDAQKTITEIFQQYNEAYFRALESNVLYDLAQMEGLVVSCGGGIVLMDRNIQMMKQSGTVVYVYRSIEAILQDIETAHRPLLSGNADIREIFNQRKERYRAACDIEIINDGTPGDAAAKIIAALQSSAL